MVSSIVKYLGSINKLTGWKYQANFSFCNLIKPNHILSINLLSLETLSCILISNWPFYSAKFIYVLEFKIKSLSRSNLRIY